MRNFVLNSWEKESNVLIYDLIQDLQIKNRLAVLFLKPGFYDFQSSILGYTFGQLIEGLLTALQLEIIFTCTKWLSDSEVRELYNSIYSREPKYPNAMQYREELLTYMRSDQLRGYVVAGTDAQKKVELVKKTYRGIIDKEPGITTLKNILHVPDIDELKSAIEILLR